MSTLKVNAIRGTGASSDAISVNSTDGTCIVKATNNLSNRNKVINGDMKISQRNGTSAIQLSATEYYIVDRFKSDTGSSYDLKADGSQATDVPAGKGFSKSLKIAADGTNTPTAGQNGGISTFLEGQDVQDFCFGSSDAKPLTLSFWAKSGSQNNGHVYGLMLGAWLGGTRNCQTKSFTVTSSWQKFTMSFAATGTAVSGSTINSDNAYGCQIYWSLVCHSDDQKNYSTWTADGLLRGFTSQDNFNDHASNEFYLTGVQLEVDSTGSGVATDFEHRSYGSELQRCLRYFELLTNEVDSSGTKLSRKHFGSAYFESTSVAVAYVQYAEKRAVPTVTRNDETNFITYHTGSSVALTALAFSQISPQDCRADCTCSSAPYTDGQSGFLASISSSDLSTISIDAEL